MGKLKKIYILILLLLLVVSSAAYFSYAYFVSRNEEHGKLNIVAGELKYKIESDSLENNQLILAANETKDLEINITSLNEIDSKYELYYTSTNVITIYYDSEYELPTGTITSKSTKTIKVQIVNNSDSEATVIFGVQGGLVNHTLSLNQGNKIDTVIPTCQYAVGEVVGTFDYTGSPEEFTAQCDGIYKLEVWGAQGGNASVSGGSASGGKGGYSYGNVTLTNNSILNIAVGSKGTDSSSTGGTFAGGYNGGGSGYSSSSKGIGAGGGGATHISLGTTNRGELKNYADYKSEVLIVAGGGGGAVIRYFTNNSLSNACAGGTGGGETGGSSTETIGGTYATGGTQTSGYGFGIGANGSSSSVCNGGGGGGYYGGNSTHSSSPYQELSGGGGSGYIGGVANGTTESGAHEGNGYAQITYLGKKESTSCENAIGDVVGVYDYTGSPQEFVAQCDGIYKLETWGAQGGSINNEQYGGYGAYSTGNIKLKKDNNLFVTVGGSGSYRVNNSDSIPIDGGYNGGGIGKDRWTESTTAIQHNTSGGGATHIASGTSNHGNLYNYVNYKDKLIMVAAGGGGSMYFDNSQLQVLSIGGHAGGIEGSKYTSVYNEEFFNTYLCGSTNANQEQAGTHCYNGTTTTGVFGIGATHAAGGGGGYYGGSGSGFGGLGGSSYINNPNLYNKAMYCYNCIESTEINTKTISTTHVNLNPISGFAKKGNGYARITYLGE